VESGVRAIIFQGGALPVTVTAGAYDVNRPPADVNVAIPATAVIICEGVTRVPLVYEGLRSVEDVSVDANVDVSFRVADAATLNANLMQGRDSLSVAELAQWLWSQSTSGIQVPMKQAPVAELDSNPELRSGLENKLRGHISEILRRNGLELVELRIVRFAAKDFDELRQQRAETFLAGERIADTERRAALNRRLRETLTADRMDKFTSAKDFEDFIRQTEHELGMKEVIREAEMESLRKDFEEKMEDRAIARRHLLERLELEHELEVLRRQNRISDERLHQALSQQKARQDAEWETVQNEVRIKKLVVDAELGDEKARIELVRMKAELGMSLRKQKIALDHEEETLRNLRELARKAEEIRLAEHVKDEEAKRRIEEKEQAARHEVEKIRVLSEAEQARLAADLRKTEVCAGMSQDQILALMAKDSPHIATAIAERARAQDATSTEMKALYEKILLDKDSQRLSEADRLERVMSRAMDAMERVAGGAAKSERTQKEEIKDVMSQGMDRMAGVATAKAGNPAGPSPCADSQVVCPTCHRQSPAGTKFCGNCGYQFYK
jgi:nucleoside diphosphate kinase